jgi:2-oxoisovalerate dehydrogenase E2 component (dihydrolipoyl transacylase)
MGEYVVKLPDVGEGVAEAELVEWNVQIGQVVQEDTALGAVMTDKASVEIPSPVTGEVVWLAGEVGDTLAVGAPFVKLRIGREDVTESVKAPETAPATSSEPSALKPESPASSVVEPSTVPPRPVAQTQPARPAVGSSARFPSADRIAPRPEGEKPIASPSVRRRAAEAGIDLRRIAGSGPAGRITHDDVDAALAEDGTEAPAGWVRRQPVTAVSEEKIVGLRRKIAAKMQMATSRIPHITYVEEIDVTDLEALRAKLNQRGAGKPKLTLLPFLMRAIVIAVRDQPQFSARFDDEANVLHKHGGVHIGIAAQTPSGLVVLVARHCETRDLWDCAGELERLAAAAKTGTATPNELSGSTISITSLGAMGGIATTPIINHPEVAIVGVNKIAVRPSWDGTAFQPRKMMNLSSSFDHRIIDGWDAAVFVQRIRALLETPTLIFLED